MNTKFRTLLLALFIASIVLWTTSRLRNPAPIPAQSQSQTSTTTTTDDDINPPNNKPPIAQDGRSSQKPQIIYDIEGHGNFWRQFQPLLAAYEPQCAPPARLANADSVRFRVKNPERRPENLEMEESDVAKLKKAHSGFVDKISKSNPPQLSYYRGTRGIVSTAGGSYLPVLVISLRMLRKTGSRLPVEVFLADTSEYEPYICDVILPYLNARCVVLSKVLSQVRNAGNYKIEKYQFKPFAMLFSSFEEILFLDADAFPLIDPESLFTSAPYANNSMITWPDFWFSTISPLYYRAASREVPPMNTRQSTESGEVVISKKTHLKTLLLCTYYNYWGPTHYYRLMSQGAAGEGDKETFVTAAETVGEPFYQVSEPIRAIGHRIEGGMAGSAMVQYDPAEDYALTQRGVWRVAEEDNIEPDAPMPRPFFIHANFPKFNPATVFTEQAVNPAFAEDGSYTRAWTIPEDTVPAIGDVEREFWREIMWTACELEDKFRSWEGVEGICDNVKDYWSAMFG